MKMLMDKLEEKKAHIAVIGLGHIGLPMASLFADVGFQVTGVDIDETIVQLVSQGGNHIKEPGLSELIKRIVRKGRFVATTSTHESGNEADVIIICVPTPITKDLKPNLTYLINACESVSKGLISKNKLIIIGSTIPPGTTKNLIAPLFEKRLGRKCGEGFWLAHCPERLLPGKALEEIVNNMKIVGGFDNKSTILATKLYQTINKRGVLATDCTTAEIVKTAENAFRDVNIAFANELALICEYVGADVMKVLHLTNTHPRVNILNPGCGVGGPCLTKDPYLLLHPANEKGFKSKIIGPARELNDYMPKHTVKLVIEGLMQTNKDVKDTKITILGVSYKKDSDDATNSPAEIIIHELKELGTDVWVYDPYCEVDFGANKAKTIEEAVRGADCLVVVTDHGIFKNLDFEKIKKLMRERPVIVEGRRVFGLSESLVNDFTYYAVGAR